MTWFREFVHQHTARHQHSQWPAPGEERKAFFGRWKAAFQRHHVTEGEATVASKEFRPPDWPRQHLDALIAHVRQQRAASGQSAGGCRDCGGMGLGYDSRGRVAYCHCPKGMWIKSTHLTDESAKVANRFAQTAPQPHWDNAAIDALWIDLDAAQRAMWLREASERHPYTARLKPVWLEAVAKVAAYRAEVLSEDPFETEMEAA